MRFQRLEKQSTSSRDHFNKKKYRIREKYISAVSKKLTPEAYASSKSRNDCCNEFCSPKVIVPATSSNEGRNLNLEQENV